MAAWLANWFRGMQGLIKMERSSGFRPYLIFFAIVCALAASLLYAFPESKEIRDLCTFIVKSSALGFIVVFAIKAFQDPNFCRSEKHVETVKKLEIMEEKGDASPQLIPPNNVPVLKDIEKAQLPGIR